MTLLPLHLSTYPSSGIFWSKDERSLLYIAKYDDNQKVDQLIQYDLATGTNQVLSEMEEILVTAGWSSNGNEIAFVAKVNEQYDIFLINNITLEQEQITNNPDIETMILWNTLDSHLLIGSVLDERSAFEGWPWGIETLSLYDTESNEWIWHLDKYLTSESVSWSPDGNQILFESAGSICLIDSDTMSEICPITESTLPPNHFVSFRTKPVWSPDGKWAAFYATRADCIALYFLEVETGAVTQGDLGCTEISFSSPIYWLSAE
jgi:Tol biopolymer transport system component